MRKAHDHDHLLTLKRRNCLCSDHCSWSHCCSLITFIYYYYYILLIFWLNHWRTWTILTMFLVSFWTLVNTISVYGCLSMNVYRQSNVLRVWNNMNVSNYWQNFCWTIPLMSNPYNFSLYVEILCVSDNRENLIGQEIWWEAAVLWGKVRKTVDPLWWKWHHQLWMRISYKCEFCHSFGEHCRQD